VAEVQTEILDDRQARLTVTVDPQRVEKEMKDAARRISRQVNIPGFRKGKAPYNIIKQYYGEDVIFEEALDRLGQEVYGEALDESEIEPYAPGVLSDVERDPVIMTFTVPLMPVVELNDYRSVRLPYEAEAITEEDVQRALTELRDQQATLDPVDRPIELGSVALLDIVGTLVRDDEGEDESEEEKPSTWLAREGVRVKVDEDSTYPVPGFPEKVIGMEADDERSFDMSFPDEDDIAEALRGKTLHFEVTCREVYEYSAPELDDEFAKDLGDYETLDDLRAEVRKQLEEAARQNAREEYIQKVLEDLVESVVEISYPPIMLEQQIDSMLDDLDESLQERGLNLEEYKRLNSLDDAGLRDEVREEAEWQLKVALLLGEVTEAEELSVSEDEINDEIETAILTFGSQAALARQFYSSPEVRRRMANRVLSQKTLDRLIAIAKGEEPPIGEPEKEVEPEEVVEAVELETGEQEAIAAVEAVTEDIIETPEEIVEGAEAEAEAKPEEELEEDNNG
jgi:trigger factor